MNEIFKAYLTTLLLLATSLYLHAQTSSVSDICLSEAELRIAAEINQFRKQNKLAEIPLSASLSFVAKTHVWDLQNNKPDTSICNASSWSDKGRWTPCCFNPYVLKYECMWDKPKELTNYPFRGYELVFYDESILQPDSIVRILKGSEAAVDMILTQNLHGDKKWLAMGIAVGENYVSIWFGQRTDQAGNPKKCSPYNNETFKPIDLKKDSLAKQTKATRYYLIYGSFTTRADANEALKRYKNSGLSKVRILEKEGRYRISLDEFDNLRDAIAAKEKMSISYPELWIFKD